MKYIKIVNLIQQEGICDYKGLDIDKFISGKQVYDIEQGNIAYIITNEDNYVPHNDLIEINEQLYIQHKLDIENRPRALTEMELLHQKTAEQDRVIEELMFVILPEMMGGGM